MYYYHYRQEWQPVLDRLNQSLFGVEMVCSMSSQLFHISTTANLKGNREMHDYLVPASYHRVTAVGSALRLKNGEHHESIIKTLVACVNNGLNQDKEIMKWLKVMKDNAPKNYQPFIQNIISWQQQTNQDLTAAKQLLRQMGYKAQETQEQNQY